MCASTVSLNFAFAFFFTSAIASAGVEERFAIEVFDQLLEAFSVMLRHYASTSTPIERAVPAMIFFAASMSLALMSGIFTLAISSSCACVSLPTLLRLGSLLPDSILSACLIRNDAGGVFVMNVKRAVFEDRDLDRNDHACLRCVRSLYCLQKSMMLSE